MNNTIQKKLAEIEREANVRILHAVESGSRAWGFASPDSDYDVRFVYVRPLSHYLKLEKTSDVIEWQLDDVLDINGWDLQKLLRLLYKSNPTIFEWNSSPIVYKTSPQWQEISEVIKAYFQPMSGLYHYLNMAKTNYRTYLKGDEVRLKKYFYVLRPLLACRWIMDRGTPPPMLFAELAAAELSEGIKPEVDRLLDLKMNAPEIATGARVDALNLYIEENLAEISAYLAAMKAEKTRDYTRLNLIFREIVLSEGTNADENL